MEGQAALYLGRRMTHAPGVFSTPGPLGPSSRLHSCLQSRSSQPAACLPAIKADWTCRRETSGSGNALFDLLDSNKGSPITPTVLIIKHFLVRQFWNGLCDWTSFVWFLILPFVPRPQAPPAKKGRSSRLGDEKEFSEPPVRVPRVSFKPTL